MTRIIAGSAGGRTLHTPKGSKTRPTTDRVREAMFSTVESLMRMSGSAVADLYAGSGALGLEAASRGASFVRCVESDRNAAALIQSNVRSLGFPTVQVSPTRVERWLARDNDDPPFDLVLVDPPYPLTEAALATVSHLLTRPGRLAVGAVVVVERSARSPAPQWPGEWEDLTAKRYGETTVHLARARSGGP